MSAYILRIETAVPDFAYAQDFAREKIKSWTESERDRRIIHTVHRRSGIDHRHSVCAEFGNPDVRGIFAGSSGSQAGNPSTRERNDVFIRESRKLGIQAAAKALAACPEIRKEEITHVITVSCTGFSNPGLDYFVVTDLGLAPSTQRYHLGFMGCYAAFPALRMAQQFCEANPEAVVLVLSVELCSLHLQVTGNPNQILANAIFADGAACAIVHGRQGLAPRSLYRLDRFASELATDGVEDMAWSIGDHGFDIVLSSYVPDIIESNIGRFVEPVLRASGLQQSDVGFWAVHPGGKAIVDKVQSSLGLPADALDVPREVLRRYGNMSSATILFVLKEGQARMRFATAQPVFAVAFGPGLTIEMAVLQALPAPAPEADAGTCRD